MTHWKLFKPKACSVRLKARDKSGALAELVDNMIEGQLLTAALRTDALEALNERELAGSTGVGMNVAIPHVKLRRLERVACSLSVHAPGLEWQAIDGAPVQIVFTVLRPRRAAPTTIPRSTSS
jgi:mannitol/fructose-specific phosphotransferase system IIA component (Ntr-type)